MRMVFPTNMTGRFLDDLATEMNTFVESILGDETGADAPVGFTPRMDVDETDTAYTLSLDLPGVSTDAVHIDMEDNQVIIHGARVRKTTDEGTEHRRVERSFGDFRRAVKLPKMVDKDAITADFDNGVLTVTMPKLVETKTSRRIEISTGTASATDRS